MKHQWRKDEKELYIPKKKAKYLEVPKMKFLVIDGQGNPNGEDFKQRIEPLYSLSYAIRMAPKPGFVPENYFEYTVYPLEGFWDLTEEGRKQAQLNKDELVYSIMIRQPDFVDQSVVDYALEKVKSKKNPHPLIDEVRFEEIEEGPCIQILHEGSYDSEPESFLKMDEYARQHSLQRIDLRHREIYLSDARRVAPEKLKTVLRYKVAPAKES